MSSADNLCKQFRSRSGPTKHQAWSASKLFDTLMVFPKEFFKKVDFEKDSRRQKSVINYPVGKVDLLHESWHKKACLWGLQPVNTQTSLLSSNIFDFSWITMMQIRLYGRTL